MKDMSDEQLVAIAQGVEDQRAFDELFRRYDSKLRIFLRSRVSESMVDDVVQEAYIKAFMNISRFRGGASFSTWLYSIAINEHKQLCRKAGGFERIKELLFRHPSKSEVSGNMDVFIDFIRRGTTLTDKQYDAYVLHVVYGYTHSEISEQLGLPLGSVKTYLAQAERQLRVKGND